MGTNLPGSVKPNSAIVGADIKNNYSYDSDIKPNNNPTGGISGGGNGSGGGSGSGGKKVSTSSASVNRTPANGFLGTNATPAPVVPIEPDTTVHDNYKAAMEAANDRLKQAYEYQQGQLGAARDNALREAYIKQQMVERRYPERKI